MDVVFVWRYKISSTRIQINYLLDPLRNTQLGTEKNIWGVCVIKATVGQTVLSRNVLADWMYFWGTGRMKDVIVAVVEIAIQKREIVIVFLDIMARLASSKQLSADTNWPHGLEYYLYNLFLAKFINAT